MGYIALLPKVIKESLRIEKQSPADPKPEFLESGKTARSRLPMYFGGEGGLLDGNYLRFSDESGGWLKISYGIP